METKLEMLYFKAPWCGPCVATSPIVEQLQQESEETGVDIKIINIDDDDNQELSNQYGVRSIPTFVFLKNGEEVDRQVGGMQKPQLLEKFSGLV